MKVRKRVLRGRWLGLQRRARRSRPPLNRSSGPRRSHFKAGLGRVSARSYRPRPGAWMAAASRRRRASMARLRGVRWRIRRRDGQLHRPSPLRSARRCRRLRVAWDGTRRAQVPRAPRAEVGLLRWLARGRRRLTAPAVCAYPLPTLIPSTLTRINLDAPFRACTNW